MKLKKSLAAVVPAFMGVLLCVSAQAQTFLTNGLLAYYPFNGNANDLAGTNNGVSYHATLITNRFGTPNSAYYFNGSNAFIQTEHPMQDLTAATFSLWFNAVTADAISDNMTLLWDADWTAYNDCTIQFRNLGGGRYGIFINANKNLPKNSWATITNGVGNFTQKLTNNWLHFVWVMTATNQTVYVDGIVVAQFPIPGNDVGYHNGRLLIGADDFYVTGTYGGFFFGIIDDIRIYNRALLTTEVQQLHQYQSQFPQLASASLLASGSLALNTTNLVVGGSYQIQMSGDLSTWLNYGTLFTATSTNTPQYADLAASQMFFRIVSAP